MSPCQVRYLGLWILGSALFCVVVSLPTTVGHTWLLVSRILPTPLKMRAGLFLGLTYENRAVGSFQTHTYVQTPPGCSSARQMVHPKWPVPGCLLAHGVTALVIHGDSCLERESVVMKLGPQERRVSSVARGALITSSSPLLFFLLTLSDLLPST